MKRHVIIEFDVPDELENYDIHYKGYSGAMQIAHEMIICAVKDYQLDVIERASNATDDDMKQHIMRFHNTQKTLKVVGYAKHSNCYYEFNKDMHE